MEYCKRNRLKCIIAFLDIKKAYDSIPRDKVWKILNELNVPACIIKVLHEMYIGEEISIKIGDLISEPF